MNPPDNNSSRLGWTKEEELQLKKLYQQQEFQGWTIISKKINKIFSCKTRTPKQCRQRYINYIKFNKQQGTMQDWTHQNDVLLFKKYMQLGSKWVQICKIISIRSQNFLKNRFYGSIRKVQRKINKVQKLNKMKKHKPIKFDSLLKILQSSGSTSNDVYMDPKIKLSYQEFVQNLKQKILQIAVDSQNSTSDQQVYELITRIHKFNTVTKFFNITKQRQNKAFKRRTLPPFPKKYQKQNQIQMQQASQKYYQSHQQKANIQKCNNISTPDSTYQIPQQFKQILQNIQNSFQSNHNYKNKNKDLEEQLDSILKNQDHEDYYQNSYRN